MVSFISALLSNLGYAGGFAQVPSFVNHCCIGKNRHTEFSASFCYLYTYWYYTWIKQETIMVNGQCNRKKEPEWNCFAFKLPLIHYLKYAYLQFSKTIITFQLLNPSFSLDYNHHLFGSSSVCSHPPINWTEIHPAGKTRTLSSQILSSVLTAGVKTNRNVAALAHWL